ncbi:MAG: hypothetical protein EOO50_00285 [Flavobacterium sp.]|uniref:alkaline phosphatase family protein n=1 Tax=Flavobacterium sp. TaxID=239 RepID=UPI001205D7BF|nr:alkaline phosphatase family protein [Flavobacterium sp.]RZJ68651.1 MAG: hypothetical protein EOO50_00285 [Flavobacterium sp.]
MTKPLLLLLLATLQFYAQNNRKVLYICIDGCRADALVAANTPAIDGLLPESIYTFEGLCAYKTWSGNGWSSMLTGTWHTKHGVTDNTFVGSNYGEYPDFLTRIEAFDPDLRTVTSVLWAPINTTIIQNADLKQTFTTDVAVKNGAVNALTNDDPDVLFVGFDDVDHAGHSFGFAPNVPQYISAIEDTDEHVSDILSALYARPNYENEDWLVVVTTDHGGTPAGHGGGALSERTIFAIYSNPSLVPEQLTRDALTVNSVFNEAKFSAGSYAQPSNQTNFQFGANQDFTVEFWVKPNAAFTGDPTFVSNKDWDSGLNPGFVISAQQNQYWKVNVSEGDQRLDIQGGYLNPNDGIISPSRSIATGL